MHTCIHMYIAAMHISVHMRESYYFISDHDYLNNNTVSDAF